MGACSKSRWKIERWTVDVLPMLSTSLLDYMHLSLRDSAILTCATIDVALAELISRRLTGPEQEIVEFLGADENGRAPCGSLGSRIQLARLLGIICDADALLLRKVKGLRNIVAHRIDMNAERVSSTLRIIWQEFSETAGRVIYLMERLMMDDPRAIRLFESDPKWGEAKPKIDELRQQWTIVTTQLKESFQPLAPGIENLTVTGIFTIVIPRLLLQDSTCGPFILALVSSVYQSLFQHLLRASKNTGSHRSGHWPR
jgi:hypothetical protein